MSLAAVANHHLHGRRRRLPAGNAAFWSTWPTGGAWLCNQLYDQYRFTGDRKFLERLYPVMKGSVEFSWTRFRSIPN